MNTTTHRRTYCDCAAWLANRRCQHVHSDTGSATDGVRVNTRADLDLVSPAGRLLTVSAEQPATLTALPLDNGGRGMRIEFPTDMGAFGERGDLILPFAAVAEFVDQVRETAEHGTDLDGFFDALDRLPARGRSRKYLDAYSLGQVEARARAE